MIRSDKNLLAVFGASLMLFLSSFFVDLAGLGAEDVFAYSEGACEGKTEGVAANTNLNAGNITFGYGDIVDRSVAGLADGLAPSNVTYAACTEALGADRYALKGYAWSDNLGFVSMYCPGGAGAYNEKVPCGEWEYGVEIGPIDKVDEMRALSGYAWNAAFGYIRFHDDAPSGAPNDDKIDYGVKLRADGKLEGYAYSEAGVYVNFAGIELELLGAGEIEEGCTEGQVCCDETPNHPECRLPPPPCEVCIRIHPDPKDFSSNWMASGALDPSVKWADGRDGYDIHLFLNNENGDPLNLNEFDLEMELAWKDTVKRNQTHGKVADNDLGQIESPFEDASNGGVLFKPVTLENGDFDYIGPGRYKTSLENRIKSYAPTSNVNTSMTTALDPNVTVFNEDFFSSFNDGIEENALVFKKANYSLKKGEEEKKGVLYGAEGSAEVDLKFSPTVYVDELYAGNLQDQLSVYRGIPELVTVNAVQEDPQTDEDNHFVPENVMVEFDLGYDEDLTASSPGCSSSDVSKLSVDFMEDAILALGKVPIGDLQNVASKVLAQLDLEEGEESACSVVEAPYLRTVVNYLVDNKAVNYYSNKLPRITRGHVANPAVTVKGNVYSQSVLTVNQDAEVLQSSGNISVNMIRDTINENLVNYLDGRVDLSEGECTITGLYADGTVRLPDCGAGYVQYFNVNGEHVAYFEGTDVHLNLDEEDWEGDWVVVVDGGHLFVDHDLYAGENSDKRMILLVFADNNKLFGQSGNMYLRNDVKNLQANMVIDGSLFSYKSGMSFDDFGRPDWAEGEMVSALSKQLFIEGSISSRNTVGGADLDATGKDFLLLGTGEVVQAPIDADKRERAQLYDLNYLRFLRMDVEKKYDTEGNLNFVDQSCGKALSFDELEVIADGGEVCSNEAFKAQFGYCAPKFICDGINPAKKYSGTTLDGDLVPLKVAELYAKGLNTDVSQFGVGAYEADANPVYIYFRAPREGSFVFSRAGGISE